MITLDLIKDKIRTLLIEKEGHVEPYELKGITDEAMQIGMTKEQIAKLVPEIDRQINWEQVRKDREKEEELKRKTQEEAAKKKQEIEQAADFLKDLVQISMDDGIVEKEEMQSIFKKATELFQDTALLSREIKTRFDAHRFRLYPAVDLNSSSLQEMLLSTNWYGPDDYAKVIPASKPQQPVTPQPPPPRQAPVEPSPKKTSYGSLIIVLLIVTGIATYFFYNQNSTSPDYTTSTSDSTSTTMTDTAVTDLYKTPSSSDKPTGSADTEAIIAPPVSDAQEETLESTGDNSIGDEEKNEIKNILTAFYDDENKGDIPGILNYFSYPVHEYYGDAKCPCDRETLHEIYTWSFTETYNYHNINVDWTSLTVEKNADGYKVTIKASYEFHKSSWSAERENQTNYPTIVIMMNNEYKIESVYQN